MADRINDIAWQAHQGSVAAIIQILNQKLAKSGVRTRAIFSDGVLQLLCEASRVEQLEQSTLVQQVQQILESIAPRKIRRVNINSRIVREEQLLWLTEIYRDRENQLLWSEEITLPKSNIVKQLIQDFTESDQPHLPKTLSTRAAVVTNKNKQKKSTERQILVVASLCTLLLLIWGVYLWLGAQLKNPKQAETVKYLPKKPEAPSLTANKNLLTPFYDPFAAAVRIANQASATGKTTKTSEQWLELATKWQNASDLMSKVPPSHSRYQEAQIRISMYRKYSEAAQVQAQKGQ
ncbi:MAG: hypothetical protein HEQ35_23920 [Gloeotrichia echinulata IR180]|jgi:hypothetical protein|nr:hypothetical protein [Gloeotrichia echinulata DEX184]